MDKQCPCCNKQLDVPALKDIEKNFRCSHCDAILTHSEIQIISYGAIYLIFVTSLLILLGENAFLATIIAFVTYHFLRPVIVEPRLDIKLSYIPKIKSLMPFKTNNSL
jgi:uncharacterized paraquat-inducible protein A